MIKDLVDKLTIKDDVYLHGLRVSTYAGILGERLKVDKKYTEQLNICGLLHDIGKLDVPDEILCKKGKLTDMEYYEVQNHVRDVYLSKYQLGYEEKKIIQAHHELMDGSGYPFGLKQNDIPFLSRVLTVADVYSALTEDRYYRKALKPYEAILIMTESVNKYDKEILNELIRFLSVEGIEKNSYCLI